MRTRDFLPIGFIVEKKVFWWAEGIGKFRVRPLFLRFFKKSIIFTKIIINYVLNINNFRLYGIVCVSLIETKKKTKNIVRLSWLMPIVIIIY